MGGNGRVKPGWVVEQGEQKHYPQGHYELRLYQGDKPIYKNVGENAAEAAAAREREAQLLLAKDSAQAAGAKIVEEKGRVKLSLQAVRFVQAAEARKAREVAVVYGRAIKEFLDVTGSVYADDVTTEDVYAYWKFLRARGNADRTVHNRHTCLYSFFKFCGIDTKPLPKAPKYETTLPEIYSEVELRTLFSSDLSDGHRLLYLLLLKSGLRDQEAQHLEWSDIDWYGGTLTVRSKARFNHKIKDAEERAVPLPPDLLENLGKWRADHPDTRLVLGTSNDRPNTKWLPVLKRHARKAGLNCGRCSSCEERGQCAHFTLHAFRRTYATTLLRAGLDVRTVQRYMGHSDMESTMRYLTPASGEAARTAIAKVNWGDQ
jgi:integrase